jgi:WD40 repeat protein
MVTSVAYPQDDKRIVSGSSDQTIMVWDAETCDVLSGPFKGHTAPVHAVTFSPDGKRIASGSEDRTVRIWDALTGDLVAGPFDGHSHLITSVIFSKDNEYVLSGSYDYKIMVWDAEHGDSTFKPFEGPDGKVIFVAFSQDGKRIASKFDGSLYQHFDGETGDVIPGRSGHAGANVTPTMSKPPVNTIMVWDAEVGNTVSKLLKVPTDLVRSSPREWGSFLQVWEIETCELVSDMYAGPPFTIDAFSQDNNRLVRRSESDDLCGIQGAVTSFRGH